MIAWKQYPNPDAGQYAYHEGFTMTAQHSGAWAVWNTKTGVQRFSILAPVVYPENERNIESAKAKAEAAVLLSNDTNT